MMEMDVKVDAVEAEALFERIEQARERLGMSLRESIAYGGTMVANSLKARTRESKKNRDMVNAPIQRVNVGGGADKRYAKFWMKGFRRGSPTITPIAGHGKGGYIRYKSLSEAKRDRRAKIGRRGLAKKSWAWIATNTITGGVASMMGVPDVGSIEWSGGYTEPSMRVTNRLRYMEHALEGGYSSVQDAFTAAANKMGHEIERKTAQTWGIA